MMKNSVKINCCNCNNSWEATITISTKLVCQKCNSDLIELCLPEEKAIEALCCICNKVFFLPCNMPVKAYHDAPNCKSYYLVLKPGAVPVVKEPAFLPVSKEHEKDKTVSIIILAWNNKQITQDCLKSIRQHTARPIQIVLVDNGSREDLFSLKEYLAGEEDILISNTKNKGFSKGNNQALSLATGEYVLFINNDTVVKEDGWLDKMIKAIEEGFDMVGPTARKVEPDSGSKSFVFSGNAPTLKGKYSYLEGWCLFGRRELFNESEGFDTQFNPAYGEDCDLSFRLRSRGKKLGVVDIPVKHLGQKTFQQLKAIDPDRSSISNRKLYKKWIKADEYNLLIRRLGAVGDVLYTTAVVEAIREKLPEYKIYYETNCPQLIVDNKCIDSFELKNVGFDMVADLLYESIPDKNLVDVMAAQAGVKLTSRKPVIYADVSKVKVPDKPYVVFHTGRSWENREWPIDRFSQVANWLKSKHFEIVEIGTNLTVPMKSKNGSFLRKFNTSWLDTMGIIKGAEFFVGLDSAPSVIAKAYEKTTFLTYGCVDPKTRYVDTVEYPLVDENIPCFGCRNKTSATFVSCQTGTLDCLKKVSAEKAISVISEAING